MIWESDGRSEEHEEYGEEEKEGEDRMQPLYNINLCVYCYLCMKSDMGFGRMDLDTQMHRVKYFKLLTSDFQLEVGGVGLTCISLYCFFLDPPSSHAQSRRHLDNLYILTKSLSSG